MLESGHLPAHLATSQDYLRQVGNFAAHPIKSATTGLVIDVEAGEAEWNLSVLEGLFELYFVQPALTARRKAAINAKLTEAGRDPLPES